MANEALRQPDEAGDGYDYSPEPDPDAGIPRLPMTWLRRFDARAPDGTGYTVVEQEEDAGFTLRINGVDRGVWPLAGDAARAAERHAADPEGWASGAARESSERAYVAAVMADTGGTYPLGDGESSAESDSETGVKP